jgi:hypothetical protein
MLVGSIAVVVLLIALAIGANWERNRRRELAGHNHVPGEEPGMVRRGYARTYGYVGGTFGDAGTYGSSSGGERIGNSNAGDSN